MSKKIFYSEAVPKILNKKGRLRVAKQIVGVICFHLRETGKLSCLDIGCSSGVITSYLADYFGSITGIDVDLSALAIAKMTFKKRNLKFLEMDAAKLAFKNESFDVVIANQLYEFVKDDEKVFREIYRVLKKGGICFFGARNKYAIIEAQYKIPFLSWIPKIFADFIVRKLGRGKEFVGKYRSHWTLKRLVKNFKVQDYTLKIIRNPSRYSFWSLEKFSFIAKILPIELFYPFIPNYIWILEK